jgi:hypothetical protein
MDKTAPTVSPAQQLVATTNELMQQPILDPVERKALAYVVEELERGKTHILTDTFLPFLKSVGAGDRLIAILKYFEGLEILTPENPPKSHPLVGRVISAYWRIEGKAVILHRALTEQAPGESESSEKSKRGRGRPSDTDPEEDEKIFNAWKSSGYKVYADLALDLGKTEKEVAQAIDRHRQRLTRCSSNRRINSNEK